MVYFTVLSVVGFVYTNNFIHSSDDGLKPEVSGEMLWYLMMKSHLNFQTQPSSSSTEFIDYICYTIFHMFTKFLCFTFSKITEYKRQLLLKRNNFRKLGAGKLISLEIDHHGRRYYR